MESEGERERKGGRRGRGEERPTGGAVAAAMPWPATTAVHRSRRAGEEGETRRGRGGCEREQKRGGRDAVHVRGRGWPPTLATHRSRRARGRKGNEKGARRGAMRRMDGEGLGFRRCEKAEQTNLGRPSQTCDPTALHPVHPNRTISIRGARSKKLGNRGLNGIAKTAGGFSQNRGRGGS